MIRLRHFAVLLSGALLVAGCSDSKPSGPPGGATMGDVEVGVITLHPQPVTITASSPGRTAASLVAEIRPQVDGLIQERLFTEGSQVKAGDLLYQIDPRTYQAAYDSAAASLQKAQGALPSAQAKVDRYRQLVGANTITAQNLDDANASLLQAKADVALAEAAVETAKINLDFTKITAPITGVIGTSTVTKGALITAKQTDAMATIRQIDPMYVDLTDSSTNLLKIRKQIDSGRIQSDGPGKISLTLEDGSVYGQKGKLLSFDANVSETTGTFSMRATIANPDGKLLPGMYVRAIADIGTDPAGFLVPQRAVNRNAKGAATAMFVNADGKVETRILNTKQSVGSNWLVDQGVADGDRLIVDGLQKVRDGATVKPIEVTLDEDGVVKTPAAAAAPAAAAPAKN